MKIVCNSSVIIALSYIVRLELLWELFEEVYIPRAVYYKACIKGQGRIGDKELRRAIELKKINLIEVKNELLVESLVDPLGKGEAEVVVASLELKSDFVCLDDKLARRKARSLGVKVKGTISILGLALKRKLISVKEFKESIIKLKDFGFRFKDELIKSFLEKVI